MVNARYNGAYYGAFITTVHPDMSYDVYFPDDADCPGEKIKHEHTKLPIQTARQKAFPTWHCYQGKVFEDPGTKKGEDPEDPESFFKAGEWVVDRVADNNCFTCVRRYHQDFHKNVVDFDIGYVMHRIRLYEEE